MSFTYMGWVGGTRAFDPILARRAWLKVSEGATVLVVDDDAIVGEMYRLALTRSGFNALVAKDGPAGLQMAAASDPALIFLDIRMPRMDGIEVLEHLMADDKNYDDSTYIKRCMGLGAKEYVVKVSIRPAELATIASRWIKPPGA
jgi:chemosensory pili system protein ChpA (sensor histidine kinase/response regulator)